MRDLPLGDCIQDFFDQILLLLLFDLLLRFASCLWPLGFRGRWCCASAVVYKTRTERWNQIDDQDLPFQSAYAYRKSLASTYTQRRAQVSQAKIVYQVHCDARGWILLATPTLCVSPGMRGEVPAPDKTVLQLDGPGDVRSSLVLQLSYRPCAAALDHNDAPPENRRSGASASLRRLLSNPLLQRRR